MVWLFSNLVDGGIFRLLIQIHQKILRTTSFWSQNDETLQYLWTASEKDYDVILTLFFCLEFLNLAQGVSSQGYVSVQILVCLRKGERSYDGGGGRGRIRLPRAWASF